MNVSPTLDIDQFLAEWQRRLWNAAQKSDSIEAEWEGRLAYLQLEKLGLLEIASFSELPKKDYVRKNMLRHLDAAYTNYCAAISERELRDFGFKRKRVLLRGALKQLQEVEVDSRDRKLRTRIARDIKMLERRLTRRHADRTWLAGMFEWREEVRGASRQPDDKEEIDSRFQRMIAALLADHFYLHCNLKSPPNLVKTISRLVVLFYLSSGLARTIDGEPKPTQTQNACNVDSVHLNLDRQGLTAAIKERWSSENNFSYVKTLRALQRGRRSPNRRT